MNRNDLCDAYSNQFMEQTVNLKTQKRHDMGQQHNGNAPALQADD